MHRQESIYKSAVILNYYTGIFIPEGKQMPSDLAFLLETKISIITDALNRRLVLCGKKCTKSKQIAKHSSTDIYCLYLSQ